MEATATEKQTGRESYASGGPPAEPQARNLYESFLNTVARIGNDVAIRTHGGEYSATWNDVRARTRRIAAGLSTLGVEKGDTVALMLNNRPEFMPCDLAIVSVGGVPFSIYQTSSADQIQYVISDADARVAIVETAFLDVMLEAKKDLPKLEHVVVVDGEGGTTTLDALEQAGEHDDEAAVEKIEPDDLLTLIYTSGTTGPPKGVQLTHFNLQSLVAGVDDLVAMPERGGRVISWLPAAHIAERGAHYYLPVVKGVTVTICPDPRQIVEFLPEVSPTWFFAVPRIWEKLKSGIEAKVSGEEGVKGKLARWAIATGVEKAKADQRAIAGGSGPSPALKAQSTVADKLVLSKLREQLGLNELQAVNVGAAPTPLEVLEFFHGLGIPIGELWGMSETCGVATANPPDKIKLGTVGPPVKGVEIKLADDGEVLVRGPMIMEGYRNMPDKTAETIDSDRWLATGDIGELDSDGYLRIVDRKKELIINAAGKNMSPANIESKLKAASPLIGQVITVGDQRPYNVALVVLDPDFAPAWAEQNGLGSKGPEELADEPKLQEAIEAGVEEANSKLSRVEQIKKFKVLPTEWMPGGDELTPTMKLKRKPIHEKYEQEIEALYAD